MNKRSLRLLILLIALGTVSACHKAERSVTTQPQTPAKLHPTPRATGIEWFKGSVQQAFAIAKAEHKPLFFYWGAVWCPPCEEVRNTVFKSKQFIALSHFFVPVFLDGDTQRAQAIGERFGVKGYPTMIVFNPAGQEITRIPGGIDISRYNSILQLSLNRLRPTKLLLELAMNKPSALQPVDFTQLAYYSWDQDNDVLPKHASPILFKQLAYLARPHSEVAAARLFMEYLVREESMSSKASPVRISGAYNYLTSILASDRLVLACWDTLAYYPEITDILDVSKAKKHAIEKQWQDRVMALRRNPSLVTAEQLAGWLPLLHYHFARTSAPLSKQQDAQLESEIEQANEATTNPFARQAVVDQIAYVYTKAKKYKEAKTVLLAELDRAAAPWYFMSDLADLAEQQHQTNEAIKWYRQAYDESKGAATRFQWGASYVKSLIRLTPDKHELIIVTAASLFNELTGPDDVFTGRNYEVLRSLDKKLQAWKKPSTKEQLGRRFTQQIVERCAREPTGSTGKQNCEQLIKRDSA